MDGQGTKRRRNIAENLNHLSRAPERYRRQTTERQRDRQTDGRTDGRQQIANVNVSSRSLKTANKTVCKSYLGIRLKFSSCYRIDSNCSCIPDKFCCMLLCTFTLRHTLSDMFLQLAISNVVGMFSETVDMQ